MGTVFLLTDAQVPDEKFLVLINDLLASGEIPDLFAGKLSVLVCIHTIYPCTISIIEPLYKL